METFTNFPYVNTSPDGIKLFTAVHRCMRVEQMLFGRHFLMGRWTVFSTMVHRGSFTWGQYSHMKSTSARANQRAEPFPLTRDRGFKFAGIFATSIIFF